NDKVQVHFVARSFDELGQTPCGLSRPLLARSTLVARFQPQEPGKKVCYLYHASCVVIDDETARAQTRSDSAHGTEIHRRVEVRRQSNRIGNPRKNRFRGLPIRLLCLLTSTR